MLVGQNGLIKKADNTTYEQSVGFLEEQMKLEAMANYDGTSQVNVEDFISDGRIIKKLAVEGDKTFYTYVFQKSNLSKNIQNNIKGRRWKSTYVTRCIWN